MSEALPRAIPEVSVRLDKYAKTKAFENFVNREFLPESLSGQDKTTSDPDQYIFHNAGRAKDGKAGKDSVMARPRMFVSASGGEPDIVSVGDYVVLRPSITDQASLLIGASTDGKMAGDVADVESLLRLSALADSLYKSNLNKGFATAIADLIVDQMNKQGTFVFEAANNAAKHQLRNAGGAGPKEMFIERFLLNQPSNSPASNKIRAVFKSAFQIGKNQPFAFSVFSEAQKLDSDLASFANNDSEFNKQDWSVFYPKATRQQPAIEVEWGGGLNGRFKLVIRKGAKSVVLYRRMGQQWIEYSDVKSVPAGANAKWIDVLVYPVGRQLIVVFGNEVNAAAIKNNALIFNLDSESSIERGGITVSMYGAMMQFKYKNVIHAPVGYMISPPFNCGLDEVENAWTNLDYVGKNNVGRDGSSEVTEFPMTNAELQAATQKHQDASNLHSTSSGEFDPRTALGLPKENVDAGNAVVYQLLTENLSSGIISQLPASVLSVAQFYPDTKDAHGQIIRYLKYGVVMVSNLGSQETLRSYSPAIEVMQVMALARHGTINMNPDPQIVAQDVVHVSVQESLESIQATVTLNNRKTVPVDRSVNNNDLGGRYTYDYKAGGDQLGGSVKTNFVGVKPITIRGGIQNAGGGVTRPMLDFVDAAEDYENIRQPIRFRGYVVSREYSRPGSGNSTVVLHCEDCSRRAKDKITMNLPIFDGWCLGGESLVLTLEGLKRIDSLYGQKFSVITSYEDSTPVIVNDCVVVKRGKKKLFRINLKNGQSIRATEDHLFFKRNENKPRYSSSHINGGWSKLSSLKHGEEIKVSDGSASRRLVSDGKDYGYDELFGWMTGDGWFSQAKRLQAGVLFAKSDDDALKKLKPYWDALTKKFCHQLIRGNKDDSGTICYGSTNKFLCDYLLGFGFKPALATEKELPSYIWTATVQQQCAFLRGLFSADGGVSSAHGKCLSIELTSASIKLVQQIQILLTSLGMVSNIIHHKPKAPDKRRWHAVELNGRSVSAFMRHIGFNIKAKNDKFEFAQVPAADKDFREIVSIEECDEEETYDVSMPSVHAFYANGIYTHNCNLAAMYYLMRDAGYPIDDIVINQDPYDPGNYVRIFDLLSEAGNNPEKFEGPCFSGHQDGVPESSKIMEGLGVKMSMNILHALMPLNIYKQQPNYMFPAGQNSWDCMAAIREFTGFYLYPNVFGRIVYQPPEVIFNRVKKSDKRKSSVDKRTSVGGKNNAAQPDVPVLTYYEVPRVGGKHDGLGYNEFQSSLNASVQTEDIRNALALFGLIQVSSSGDPKKLDSWSPHIVVKRPNDLANDVNKPWFVPWLRWTIVKNPQWSDPRRNEQLAEELYKRLRKTKMTSTFKVWGSPSHYAYMVFKIDESLMNEMGVNQLEFVTTQIAHEFDARNLTYYSNISGEHLDFDQFDFAPHVSGRPLAAYTGGNRPGRSPFTGGRRRPI